MGRPGSSTRPGRRHDPRCNGAPSPTRNGTAFLHARDNSMPHTAEQRPVSKGAVPESTTSASTIQRGSKPRPPLAPASVFGPVGRRHWWWYTFRCKTCGTHQFGRAKTLDAVTGVRRAGCGHRVNVMAARIYGAGAVG